MTIQQSKNTAKQKKSQQLILQSELHVMREKPTKQEKEQKKEKKNYYAHKNTTTHPSLNRWCTEGEKDIPL